MVLVMVGLPKEHMTKERMLAGNFKFSYDQKPPCTTYNKCNMMVMGIGNGIPSRLFCKNVRESLVDNEWMLVTTI